MNCPHCQQEMPAGYTLEYCPFCRRDLFPDQTSSAEPSKINWPLFFAALLAPAVLSFIGMAFNFGGLVVLSPLAGSLIAGAVCSTLLDRRYGFTTVGHWLVAAGLGGLSFFLCFGGCMAGALIIKH